MGRRAGGGLRSDLASTIYIVDDRDSRNLLERFYMVALGRFDGKVWAIESQNSLDHRRISRDQLLAATDFVGLGRIARCRSKVVGTAFATFRKKRTENGTIDRNREYRCSMEHDLFDGCAGLLLSPWALRNRAVMGSTIWTTTHGGYTLLLANNPILFRHIENEGLSRKWDDERFHQLWSNRSMRDPTESTFWDDQVEPIRPTNLVGDEVADDRLANQTAWHTIRHPLTFLKACFARFLWLWAWWPAGEQVSIVLTTIIGLWYGVVGSLFALGIYRGVMTWRSHRASRAMVLAWLPAIALILGLTAVHMVYWSNMRMRAPAMPMVVVIAAMSATGLRKP